MKISDMETLLQQEMEAVHGGLSGTNLCKCESGAHVNVTGGSCECASGAEAYVTVTCTCGSGAKLADSLVTPPGGLGCLIGLSR